MSKLEIALATLVRDLAGTRTRAALVGGLAVSARTEPRFTRDLDLAVAIGGDAEAEALVQQLVSSGYGTITLVEQEATRRLATVRLTLPGEDARGVVADLLFASSGIETEVVHEAESLEVFPHVVVPVARAGHLIAQKLLSRDDRTRPQDVADLRALFAVASEAEIELARAAAVLIEQRGFARGRDLAGALREWLAERGS